MFQPSDEPSRAFEEPWQAQAMAMADTLIKEKHIDATEWASALGDEIRQANARGMPDNTGTYYSCVLAALEKVTEAHAHVTAQDRAERRAAWEAAYLKTPHGQQVKL